MSRVLINLVLAGTLAAVIGGCGESAEDASKRNTRWEVEEAQVEQIIPSNRNLIYHVCYPGKPNQWKMHKYDFGGETGSYAIINGSLNWYLGDSRWMPVENRFGTDPWLRKLKKEMNAKIDAMQVEGEGLTTE